MGWISVCLHIKKLLINNTFNQESAFPKTVKHLNSYWNMLKLRLFNYNKNAVVMPDSLYVSLLHIYALMCEGKVNIKYKGYIFYVYSWLVTE